MLTRNQFAAFALAVALLASSVPASAQNKTSQPTPRPGGAARASAGQMNNNSGGLPPIKFTEFRLNNGLRVILHEDHSTPIVGVNLWYHVGSKNEVPGKTGFAHLFEHMMFQGSKSYDDDYFKPIQEAGGNLNGSTNPDRTNYWEVVPSNFLELALFMEADRLGGLLDVLNEAKLANQREVVKNEKRQNYDNRPYGLVSAKINETLYPKTHPYHWLTIGSLDDLSAASLEDVKNFFRRYYTPNNATLAIAGDFTPAEARRLVEKYFGSIPRGPEVTPVPMQPATITELKRINMEDRVALPRVYTVWAVPPQYTPDEASLDALASILAGGKSSRLYKTLVYERQIAQDVSAFNNSAEIAGQFQIVATAKPGKTLAELEGAINEELERIKQTPPTTEEIERAYNAREASFIYSLQTVGGFGGKNDQLNQYATFLNRPDYFNEDLARYRRVTPEDVKRVANQYLTDKRLIVNVTPRARGRSTGEPVPESPAKAVATPAPQTAGAPQTGTAGAATAGESAQTATKAAAAATAPAGAAPPTTAAPAKGEPAKPANAQKRDPKQADASAAVLPKPGSEPRLVLPKVERHRLSNGLQVFLVRHSELPVVNMNLIIRSGAASDPENLPGAASLTADLLDEGTKTRNALEISNALASIGARLGVGAGWDSSSADLTTLTRHLDRALEIYADVLLNPAFPEADLKRLRASRLATLQQQRDNADAIAGLVYSSILYGNKHPYGRPLFGNEASLTAIAEADVRRFYETYYRPNNAALIVAGDVTAATLLPKLERAFAAWKPGQVPSTDVSMMPPPRERAGIYLVDKPGAAQSVIQIGQVGVARSTPDYFPLLVLNSMLGGQFVSRINLNLREDKGYTYGARSGFDYRRGAGPFAASGGVFTNVTKESVSEFLKELRGIRGEIPVTERELEYAKQGILRGFPRGFETPAQIADRLSSVVLHNLPDDYFNNYSARVRAVTLADITRVANRYLDPSRMAILVVGDRKAVEPGLRSLGIGEGITLLDAEGRPVAAASGDGGGSK
ncbi:MAG TPA: pitrilysin family protein [Pyrinomonadaceae bacterium]|jgi:zinc protease|nr:pitrilysin family protein [Pyrinomonadaceae bacterium]